jgi:hypothetical protein
MTIRYLIHSPDFYLKHTIDNVRTSLEIRTYITYIKSLLRAQQVNAIDRFVKMVYYYNSQNSGHYVYGSYTVPT